MSDNKRIEAFAAVEAGEDVPPGVDSAQIRREHEQLAAGLAALARGADNPAWMDSVFEDIDGVSMERAPRRRQRWATIALSIAAAAALVLVLPRPSTQGPGDAATVEPSLTVEVLTRPGAIRGSTVAPGSKIRITASGPAAGASIWLYLNGRRVVAQCRGGIDCTSIPGAVALDVVVSARGRYLPVLVRGRVARGSPTGNSDLDLANAVAAGLSVYTAEPIDVH